MIIKFSKYQGCGNDFIIIDNLNNSTNLSREQIKNLCNRHFGIGADGLILVENRNNSYYMNYYNSDGSLAEMCGNGMRCTAQFLIDNGLSEDDFTINSFSGVHNIKTNGLISVSLPKESYEPEVIGLIDKDLTRKITLGDKTYDIDFVSMGNPHGVILVKDLNDISEEEAKKISTAPFLKNGANINFVQLVDSENLKIKTYERGDGFTLACGTGTCASAVISNKNKLTSKNVNVYNPGGCLNVDLKGNQIILSGKAEKVFDGEVEV